MSPTPLELAKQELAKVEAAEAADSAAVTEARELVHSLEQVTPPVEPPPVEPPPNAATWLGLNPKAPIPASVALFSENSFWRHPLTKAQKTPVANSAQLVAEVVSMSGNANGTPANLNVGTEWGKPVFLASTTDSPVRISGGELNGQSFPIPSFARPATGGDGQMTIILPDGSMLDFYQCHYSGGSTLSCTTSTHTKGAAGLGNESVATAANFDLLGGIPRWEELQTGELDHGLFIVLKSTAKGHIAPAWHDDGQGGSNVQEGQAFCLNFGMESVEAEVAHVKSLGLSPQEQSLALGFVKHYNVVGDKGATGFSIGIPCATAYTALGLPNPWHSVAFPSKIEWAKYLVAIGPPPAGTYVAH